MIQILVEKMGQRYNMQIPKEEIQMAGKKSSVSLVMIINIYNFKNKDNEIPFCQ